MASSSRPPPTTANASPHVFPPFKLLPLELRQMIWMQAALEPRVVELGFYEAKTKNRRRETRNTSKTLVPALLHTCSESRAVGLMHYEKLIPTGIFTGTYINWAQDYVYLDCSHGQFIDFKRYQEYLQKRPGHQKGVLPQKCRRLLVGRRLHAPRVSLFNIFDLVEDVAVLHSGETWSYSDGVHNETSGTIGSDFSLLELNHNYNGSDTRKFSSEDHDISFPYIHYFHDGSYRPMWSYIESNCGNWKSVSLVKATRGSHRPLSKEEKANRRERERQEKLDKQAPRKPEKTKFENWRVSELQAEAEDRGLGTEGSKSELVTQLQANEYIPYSEALEEYEQAMEEYRKAKKQRISTFSQV